MEPLDLSVKPPRGPREQLLGVAFLPRTIDKMRGQLPGGNLARYIVDMPTGFSAFVLSKLGVDLAAMKAEVARAATEDDVVAWLRAHADLSQAASINEKLEKFEIGRLPETEQASVRDFHPVLAGRPELTRFMDIFEADDAEVSAR